MRIACDWRSATGSREFDLPRFRQFTKLGQSELVGELLNLLEEESDTTVFYAGWQALRTLSSFADRRALLTDSRAAVRRAALLSLLETQEITRAEVQQLVRTENDAKVRQVASLWTEKMRQAAGPAIKGRSLREASGIKEVATSASPVAAIRNLKSRSRKEYRIVAGGFVEGNRAYVDRGYRLTFVPSELVGYDLIQTANGDESSRGDDWLSAEAIVPVRVFVGIDEEQEAPPAWLTGSFKKESFTASIDEGAKFVFYSRTFDEGSFELGGNTENGDAGSMVNYLVAVAPLPLERNASKVTTRGAMALVDQGNRDRGEVLFRHLLGAGCAKCHSLDKSKNGFGPNLSNIGSRSNARHIVQSIVEPSEIITEGFNQQTIVTDEGKMYSGVLLEESGLSLSLGESTGERIDIPKSSIEERNSNPVSAMPDLAETLTPLQVADLAVFLLAMKDPVANESSSATPVVSGLKDTFHVERQENQLLISLREQPIVEFVFRDDRILRPYFSNARLLNGLKVTRNHPPLEGVDELDHANLHPGIWLAFGDINGHDFWRNKATMEHVRFVSEPAIHDGQLRFATECRLKKRDGEPLCRLTNEYILAGRPNGWRLIWNAEFRAEKQTVVFGDQEEMGFGARMATAFTEKNGGRIRSSTGKQTAKKTWGQPAFWCDYSGADPNSGGIMLMASPDNFRQSWWHNRNYGAFVSNPFGRKAMKQGETSSIAIAPGKTMRITFGAMVHDHREFNAKAEYEAFKRVLSEQSPR